MKGTLALIGVLAATATAPATDEPRHWRIFSHRSANTSDAKLGGWLPSRMDEEYSQRVDDRAAAQLLKQATAGGLMNGRTLVVITGFNETITCAATYSNDRRFETSARIVPPK
jgi:hypothetical protein